MENECENQWSQSLGGDGGGFHQQTMDRQIWDQMWNSASMCFLCYLYIYIYIVLYVFQGDVQLCTQLKQCDMYISEIQQTIMYIYIYIYIWLVVYQPLWKIWFRQLGLLFPNIWKVKKFMFQTTNQMMMVIIPLYWWLLSHYMDPMGYVYIYYNYVDGILQKFLCLATPNPNRNPQSQLSLGASKYGSIKHSINHGKFRLKPT